MEAGKATAGGGRGGWTREEEGGESRGSDSRLSGDSFPIDAICSHGHTQGIENQAASCPSPSFYRVSRRPTMLHSGFISSTLNK